VARIEPQHCPQTLVGSLGVAGGVEPTNNTAERAFRHEVIRRKLWFGTQVANGSRFVERALTVIETCRLQKRSAFAYVTEAVEAHMAGRKAPSLLPAP
jgi:transposase